MKLPTYNEIIPYIEKKLVSENAHPDDPDVRIFNYTPETQFSQAWDDVTRQCRGLILNVKTGEVLARPFPKFFNYSEHVGKGWPIPAGIPKVYEKLDGSLGILYHLNGEPWVATRGSFTSDQALWATDWYRKNRPADLKKGVGYRVHGLHGSDEGDKCDVVTCLYEILFPENRIVVNYNYSGLVHLATIKNTTGEETPFTQSWIRKPKEIPFTSLEALAAMDEPGGEGFVIFFPDTNERMKIKFPEYIRLHKIMTGLSEIGVWEHLREGKDIEELIKDVPDEMYSWIKSVSERLWGEYGTILGAAKRGFFMARNEVWDKGNPSRKDWASAIKKHMKDPSLGFLMLDKKQDKTAELIWKMVRPSGKHTFKVDIDE